MDQKQFLERLVTLAQLTGREIPREAIQYYDKVFAKVGYDKGCKAIGHVIMTRRTHDPIPSVGDLVRIAVPQLEPEDQAVEVAGRIVEAITRFGWCNERDALEHVGEVGQYVVKRAGGWQNVCQTMRAEDVKTWVAQFRQQALSAIRRAKAGHLELAPGFSGDVALPAKLTQLIQSTTKSLENDNGKEQPAPVSAPAHAQEPGAEGRDDAPGERGGDSRDRTRDVSPGNASHQNVRE